jgi:hypothetical protein
MRSVRSIGRISPTDEDAMTREVEPSALSANRRAAKAAAGARIATGNRLRDGAVVYLAADGVWTTDVAQARTARGEAEEAHLKAALDAAVARNVLIDAAVIDADDAVPARLRERIRAVGPSVRPDLARRQAW